MKGGSEADGTGAAVSKILFLMKKRILLCGLALLALSLAASAGEVSDRTQRRPSAGTQSRASFSPSWYAGAGVGAPIGLSTLSSFGSAGFGMGWSAEAFLGRRLTPALSVEASVSAGRSSLSARGCCVDGGYWLGSDGVRYNAPVIDKEGWDYSDLRCSISLLGLDARLNVDILGLSRTLRGGPWSAGVSPSVTVARTSSTMSSDGSGESTGLGGSGWNIGIGARLQAGRRIGGAVRVSLYCGATHLFGRRIDGVPRHDHSANLLAECGSGSAGHSVEETDDEKDYEKNYDRNQQNDHKRGGRSPAGLRTARRTSVLLRPPFRGGRERRRRSELL